MKASVLFAAALTVSGAVAAQAGNGLPPEFQATIDGATKACADFEGGKFALQAGAVVRTDLDGDLQPDWVLNEMYFTCSSAASLYGGTGGHLSHFLVGDHVFSLLNQGWEMRTLGRNRVLLAELHGTHCEAVGYSPCVTASVWDSEAGSWRSAATPWER